MKPFFKKYPIVTITAIVICILSISSFKSSEEKKQVMTIHVFDYAADPGIYIYVDGSLIETVTVKKQSLGTIPETTASANKIINKYYNDGWRLTAVMPTIYLLEK